MFRRLWHLFLLWKSLARDKRVPGLSKAFPVLALIYLVFPFDIIPDILPVLGWLDDVGMLVFLITLAMKFVPKSVWDEHKGRINRSNVIDV